MLLYGRCRSLHRCMDPRALNSSSVTRPELVLVLLQSLTKAGFDLVEMHRPFLRQSRLRLHCDGVKLGSSGPWFYYLNERLEAISWLGIEALRSDYYQGAISAAILPRLSKHSMKLFFPLKIRLYLAAVLSCVLHIQRSTAQHLFWCLFIFASQSFFTSSMKEHLHTPPALPLFSSYIRTDKSRR